MPHRVYLALGTNLGDRLANLRRAFESLEPQAHILRTSQVYETPPWGYLDQPAFLNQVAEIETELSPQDLLALVKKIEGDMGRVKTILNGPRLIDLDILFYDDLVMDQQGLVIPHPRMEGRGFVLVPLDELVPCLIHPVFKVSIHEMCSQIDRSGIQVYRS